MDPKEEETPIKEDKKEVKVSVHRYTRERLTVPGIVLLAIPAALTLIFSDYPYYSNAHRFI